MFKEQNASKTKVKVPKWQKKKCSIIGLVPGLTELITVFHIVIIEVYDFSFNLTSKKVW